MNGACGRLHVSYATTSYTSMSLISPANSIGVKHLNGTNDRLLLCGAGEMANPEDIELGDMEAEEQVVEAADDLQVEQKAVPDAVFGASGIQPQADAAAADTEPHGALERLKKRRTG